MTLLAPIHLLKGLRLVCGLWLTVCNDLSLSLSQTFLGYTDAGAMFVFGEKYTDHFFAFKVTPGIFSLPAY